MFAQSNHQNETGKIIIAKNDKLPENASNQEVIIERPPQKI